MGIHVPLHVHTRAHTHTVQKVQTWARSKFNMSLLAHQISIQSDSPCPKQRLRGWRLWKFLHLSKQTEVTLEVVELMNFHWETCQLFFSATIKRKYDSILRTFNLLIPQRNPSSSSLEDFAEEAKCVGKLIKTCHDVIVPRYNADPSSRDAHDMQALTESLHEYRAVLKNILKFIKM